MVTYGEDSQLLSAISRGMTEEGTLTNEHSPGNSAQWATGGSSRAHVVEENVSIILPSGEEEVEGDSTRCIV